jgi:hypothetical protein
MIYGMSNIYTRTVSFERTEWNDPLFSDDHKNYYYNGSREVVQQNGITDIGNQSLHGEEARRFKYSTEETIKMREGSMRMRDYGFHHDVQ